MAEKRGILITLGVGLPDGYNIKEVDHMFSGRGCGALTVAQDMGSTEDGQEDRVPKSFAFNESSTQ